MKNSTSSQKNAVATATYRKEFAHFSGGNTAVFAKIQSGRDEVEINLAHREGGAFADVVSPHIRIDVGVTSFASSESLTELCLGDTWTEVGGKTEENVEVRMTRVFGVMIIEVARC
jgi:hypothetical protein